ILTVSPLLPLISIWAAAGFCTYSKAVNEASRDRDMADLALGVIINISIEWDNSKQECQVSYVPNGLKPN
ncbi:MAG TPA: hypothetical protein PL112_17770, partial [Candidatus Obscuribacter sp.]|nr:hypothetical protein [Candidatus Obscuribacter sp.]